MATKKNGPATGAGSDISAASIEVRPLESLAAYARNARTHDDEQIAQLMGSIIEFGFTNPILADGNGIVAGHGRSMAARRLYEQGKTIRLPNGRELPPGTVPVLDVSGWSEAKRRAYIIADNKLALNADWDYAMLAVELDELKALDFDITLTGFGMDELDVLISGGDEKGPGNGDGMGDEYTKKIEIPIYTPKGEKPAVESLVDTAKTNELIEKINASGIGEKEKEFLLRAASRHAVFDYHAIAEFYCHATPEMQRLMEDSSLVLIDFNKAVENGYVQMSEKLEGIYTQSHGEDNDDDEE